MIDHTLLEPDVTISRIEHLCGEAREFGFAAVCVNPCFVPLCSDLVKGSNVKVCTVVSFPLGASSSMAKASEAEKAIRDGALELDVVINIGMLKSANENYVMDDIRGVVEIAKPSGVITKAILETSLLTEEEKMKACLLAKQAGADFVKTSTGYGRGGATPQDVALLRRIVGPSMGVKASGGIRTYQDARAMIQSGANRIGTSSSVQIVTGRNKSAANTNDRH
jgi:deoxyribose-phosphate aldolase